MAMNIFGIKGRIFIAGLLLLVPLAMMGQQERKYIRKGNRLYEKEKYAGSETQYHRAEGIDKPVPDASFNVGDALYKQKKYSEASENYDEAISSYKDPLKQAEAYYNQGNSLLKDKKFKESIEAYINSLKITPDNMNAKYNLAYAQNQLKKQQDEQKKQQDQEKQKNKDQNKDKKDQNKDQQNKDQNKDQQNKDQNKDQQNKDQNKDQNQNQDQGQGQPQPQGMTKEDAKRLLDALSANEKDVQEKVKKDKMSQVKARVVKNW
jgi:Ca-activated chloride channel homolog